VRGPALSDAHPSKEVDMERLLGRFAPQIFAVTRILSGVLLACHGAQKLLPVFGGPMANRPPLMTLAGTIELGAGTLIALGLFASYAAFLASGLMAAAYFMAHATQGFWPVLNHGDLAIVFCWFFLFVAAHGPGPWALDGLRKKA
jgi:putative oxidoreductase